jgi:nucleoside-triphosphatase THEP1
MKESAQQGSHSLVYYRLIAIWVLCEAMLGGIIHGLKLPVSGLIVGSSAIVCICLIAWYVPQKGAILKATIIVAIFKMTLSPQSPPTAYIAVFFQGLMGELLFWNRRFFRLSCMLLALLGLLESGLQRILKLTLVAGNDLWTVINDFFNELTHQKTRTNYSLIIGVGYVVLHLLAGLFIGWWASGLPMRVSRWNSNPQNKMVVSNENDFILPITNKRKKTIKSGLFIIWVILLVLYLQSHFRIGKPILPSHIALKILVRSFLIVFSWYFIAGPLLKKMLHNWLKKRQEGAQKDVQLVLQLLPSTQNLILQSWKRSADKKGWKRIKAWTKLVLVNALYPTMAKQLFILSAPVQTGKTTSLQRWSDNRDDVSGILTPVMDGRRMFLNIRTGQQFHMEARKTETDTLQIGRFVFSKNNFDIASQVILDNMNNEGWLVIDEIGPMELAGKGFCDVLKTVLTDSNCQQKLLLVVREGIVEKVKTHFQITDAVLIRNISELEEQQLPQDRIGAH